MRALKKERTTKAFRVVFIFFTCVLLLILFSLIIKVSLIISRSHFSGTHQFIMQVSQSSDKSEVILFSPDQKSLSIISLIGSSAGGNAQKSIQIPIDSYLHDDSVYDSHDNTFVQNILMKNLFLQHKDITIFDIFRLLVFSHGVSHDRVFTKKVDMSTNISVLDNQLTQLFTDASIYKQGDTVAIVNGSGIAGLGNALARLLTHIGVNVISVTTSADSIHTSSVTYFGGSSYTIQRMNQLLHMAVKPTSDQQVAKITITIGTDRGEELESNL